MQMRQQGLPGKYQVSQGAVNSGGAGVEVQAKAQEEMNQLVGMILGGLGISEIARRKGLSKGTISKRWKKIRMEWREDRGAVVDEIVEIENKRIDMLFVGPWNAAMKQGATLKDQKDATEIILRLMERRARLLGLDAATQVDLTSNGEQVKTLSSEELVGSIASILASARSRREAAKLTEPDDAGDRGADSVPDDA